MQRVFDTLVSLQGGFAIDLAPQIRLRPEGDADPTALTAEQSYLTDCEDAIYEVSGNVRKLGGAARINATAISASPTIVGMFDYWLAGTGGSFTQMFVVVTSDGRVFKEDMDGTFDAITGTATIGPNTMPVFCQARDLLTIWFSDNSTPLKYNQAGNVAALGGTPPAGRGACYHVNRVWVWGTNANPNRLTYSSATSVEDYTGADTGTIDIEPEDGDRIIACVPHKNRLLVFKGPNKGSIHQIAGTAPTGSDAFSRTLLTRSLAMQSANGWTEVGDDIWFMSERGIHSLAATEKFGNFTSADLTFRRPGTGWFLNRINRSRMNRTWAVHYGNKSCVVFTMASAGNSWENRALCLSYIAPERGLQPSLWLRTCASAAIRVNPATLAREVVFGNREGRVLRQDMRDRNIETSTAYTMRLRTPQILLGQMDAAGRPRVDLPVALQRAYLKSQSVGNYNVTLRLKRDENAAEVYTFGQAVAGFLLGTSVLGTGILGDNNLQTVSADLAGEARAIELELIQGGLDQDANLYEVSISAVPSSDVGASTLA